MISIPIATQLSDGDLVSAVTRLVAEGRHRTADLISLLVALETRTVHVEAGYPSLFRFCVGRLRLSEEEAFYRIAASRVAARFPVVLERLREGRLTLTAVALLRKHLTEANHLSVLEAAEGRSKREIQALVARLAPRPDVPVSIRKLAPPRTPGLSVEAAADAAVGRLPIDAARAAADLPFDHVPVLDAGQTPRAAGTSPRLPEDRAASPSPGPSALAAPPRDGGATRAPAVPLGCSLPPAAAAVVTPLAPGRYSLRLTISEETHAKLRRAQDLLAHTVPAGDTAAVLDRALTLLVAHLERQKYAALRKRPKERALPAARRRAGRLGPVAADAATAQEPPPARSTVASSPAAPPGVAAAGAAPKETSRRRRRYIPAAVRREVWRREAGRCGYMAPDGNRCAETAGLEFHHTIPVADGGEATASTVVLRCVRHHTLETRRWFGEEVTAYRGNGPREGVPGARGHPGWP